MQYLVLCTCYHSVERHDESGCLGDAGDACECRFTKVEALDAAISAAANEGWRAQHDTALGASATS
jgi:hypothetical protein